MRPERWLHLTLFSIFAAFACAVVSWAFVFRGHANADIAWSNWFSSVALSFVGAVFFCLFACAWHSIMESASEERRKTQRAPDNPFAVDRGTGN